MVETSKVLGGKYQIISEIKKGGFGIVYYGFDKNLGKAVAIKEIAPELLEEAKYIDMFQAEARNAAKLNHHNIVHIFDLLKTEDGHFYIVMEYVDGVDLYKIIKRSKQLNRRLSINLATYVVGEVCKALEYAHNRKDMITGEPLNLIHQDISPSNIMVSMKGDVKVIDFGIARVRNEKSDSQNVVVTGKIPYMSPEQLNGGYFIDGRSDIYSLAIVFYELITGKRLFQAKSDAEIIENIRNGKVDLRMLQEIETPQTIQHIIARALENDVSQRFQSANQMYLDLAQYLMVSSKTIELSEELGILVKDLFYSNDPVPEIEPPSGNKDDNNGRDLGSLDLNIPDDESLALSDPDNFASNFPGPKGNKPFNINDRLFDTPDKDDKELDLEPPFPDESESAGDSNEENDGLKPPAWDIREFETETQTPDDSSQTPDDSSQTLDDFSQTPDDSSEIPLDLGFDFKVPDEKPLHDTKSQPAKPETPTELKSKTTPFPKKTATDEFSPAYIPSPAQTMVEEEGEDDIKTVIDVVRLTSRSYKKQILAGFSGIFFILFLFLSLDTMFRFTGIGESIHNYFFPPAIKIVSYPEGARIYLDDELIDGQTPLSIQKISPGVHKLKLIKAGFPPIVKSISVPEKGEIKVEGSQKTASSDAYIFRFMTRIEIQSIPAGADVIVNGTQLSQKTPCEIQWEAGKNLSIELEKEGFQRLTGFTFNLAELESKKAENRFWKVTSKKQRKNFGYVVQGFFRKLVQVHSSPAGASIYIDDEVKPVGITGSKSIVYLTLGEHLITVKRNGFIPKSVTLDVSENSTSRISLILKRKVSFQSKNANELDGPDLGATLVYLKQGRRRQNYNRKTPLELTLSAITAQALFRKPGYEDKIITISSTQKRIVVPMHPSEVPVEIVVTDAVSGKPLPNVQVYYRPLNNRNIRESLLEVTDANGRCRKSIPQGQYIFKVVKKGYFQRRNNYTTSTKRKNRIRFNLVAR